jgi:uncharacterized protein YraI
VNNQKRFWFVLSYLLIISALLSAACNLGVPLSTPTPRASATSSQKPTVTIQAPQNGADAVVGQAITVQATGSHPNGITRLELRANAQQVDSKISQNPLGDQTFAAYLNYTPVAAGTLVLQVIAYYGNVPSDPAAITVNVKAQAAQVTATVAAPSGATAIVNDPTCRARVEVNGLNFRSGPGVNYPSLAVLSLGTSVIVTGRLNDRTWWQGRIGNTLGWMNVSYVSFTGSLCSSIPAVVPPPSPVPSPTFTKTSAPITASLTPTTSIPDLVIIKVEGAPSVILNADNTKTITYKVTVQNVGNVATGSFNVGMVLPDGTLRDMGAVAALAVNQQAVFQTDITFTAPGSVRLTAFADMNQVVTEGDEANNLKPYDVVLIKPTDVPVATVAATSASTSAATP